MSNFGADVHLYQTNDGGEITVTNGVVDMRGGLDTAVYLSMFGGNYQDSGQVNDRNQWWGNLLETDNARKFRGEVQSTLNRLPLTAQNLTRIRDAALRDIDWMLQEGVASSVDVEVINPALNTVQINVTILAQGLEQTFSFVENWKLDYQNFLADMKLSDLPELEVVPSTFTFDPANVPGSWTRNSGTSLTIPVAIPDPSDPASWTLIDAAAYVDPYWDLMGELSNTSGGMWYTEPLKEFQVSFDFQVFGTGIHADGFCFVVQGLSATQQSQIPQGTGQGQGHIGILQAMGICLDTFQNSAEPSPLSIICRDSDLPNGYFNGGLGGAFPGDSFLAVQGGAIPTTSRRATITIRSDRFSVSIDGTDYIVDQAFDFSKHYNVDNKLWFGLTAGSGGNADRHQISNVAVTVL